MNDALNEYMTNPKAFIIKKWISQVIGAKAPEHFDIIERCAKSLVTQKDLEDFSKLIGCVYEAGFYKAASDYKKELVKHNIKVNVETEIINQV